MSLSKPVDKKANFDSLDAYNPLAIARYVPVSADITRTMRRMITILSSVGGLDRVFMIVNYGFPLLAQILTRSIDLSRVVSPLLGDKLSVSGLRRIGLAASMRAAAAKASDLRMGMRMFGLLPMVAWMFTLEDPETQPKNFLMRNIQRLQVWSMLIYYPLEHAYYLGTHNVITLAPEKRVKALVWACRAWLAYLALDLVKQSFEARALSDKMAAINLQRKRDNSSLKQFSGTPEKAAAGKVDTDALVEHGSLAVEEATLAVGERECIKQSQTLINSISANLAYLPPSIHWSLPNGLYTNAELWTGVFGSLVSIYGLQARWKATA